jgi:hypothetical protein
VNRQRRIPARAYSSGMTLPDEAGRELDQALCRIAIERRRAARAAEIADRHELQAGSDPGPLSEFHDKMAAMHRRAECRHLAAAGIHAAHADRLRRWAEEMGEGHGLPRFIATVAQTVGADSVAITLFGSDRTETLVEASDLSARTAQDLEFTLGEGPSRDAVEERRPVVAAGAGLARRWSHYGPAVAALGISSVVAVPVRLSAFPFGALTVFGPPHSTGGDLLEPLLAAADTIALAVLPASGGAARQGNPEIMGLFGQADRRSVVHQAAGTVSVQCGCGIGDALALIRAHAFAEGRSVDAVASDIVHRRLRLA